MSKIKVTIERDGNQHTAEHEIFMEDFSTIIAVELFENVLKSSGLAVDDHRLEYIGPDESILLERAGY